MKMWICYWISAIRRTLQQANIALVLAASVTYQSVWAQVAGKLDPSQMWRCMTALWSVCLLTEECFCFVFIHSFSVPTLSYLFYVMTKAE